MEVYIALGNLIVQLVFLGTIKEQTAGRMKVLIVLRIIRMVKFLILIPIYRLLFDVLMRLHSKLLRILSLLMCVYFFLAFIGVNAFGGKIFLNNKNLVGSAYDSSFYYYYNFNDFPNALVVNFNLQIVNNWNVMFDGVERATSGAARLYFITFWVIVVIVITNVYISFLIEVKKKKKLFFYFFIF